jgi:ATP-binding cassette subfamily B protein
VLNGLIPLINVWALKSLVDAVPHLVHPTGALQPAASGEASGVWLAVGLLIFSWFGVESLQPLSQYCREQLNDLLSRDINLMIIDRVNRSVGITILENPKFYDTLQKLRGDMAYKPIQMLMVTSQLARAVVTFGSLLLVLSTITPLLNLLIILLCLPKTLYQIKKSYDVWKIFEGDAPELRRMEYYAKVVTNNLDAKEIRLFGLGSYFRDLYTKTFKGFQERHSTIRKSQLLWSTLLSLVSALGTGGAYIYTIQAALRGMVSVGSMAMYIGCIAQMEQCLTEVSFLISELYRHVTFLQMLYDFVATPEVAQTQTGAEAGAETSAGTGAGAGEGAGTKTGTGTTPDKKSVPATIEKGIEFRNVSFKYPDSDNLILDDLSFKLDAASTVAIVAENGAGKTTIVKLLARLYEPTSGQILLDGVNLSDIDAAEWRARMTVVFQDYCRFQMTVRENIGVGELSAIQKLDTIESAAKRSGASSIANKLASGYETILGKMFEDSSPGTELSGGEWQKIALARAFMRSPSSANEGSPNGKNGTETAAHLLILDEPTAALDVQSEYDVFCQFHEMTKGKMALLISHRFSTVKIADRILVLDKGKIVENGSHKELMAAEGQYARLYKLQAERYL